MRRLLPLLLAAAALSACVGYPRPHFRRFKGQAELGEDGQPLKLAATIVKYCESWQGETEHRGRMRETVTDAKGHYSLTVMGVAWNFKNLFSSAGCTSDVQLFACRPHCKKADQIDIDVLGK
jgi:hypothetical protein